MSRAEHDSVWRAQERIITVLDSDLATRVTAIKPAGLTVNTPASAAYYALGGQRAVSKHKAARNPRCYVYPDPGPSAQRQDHKTQGTTTRPVRQRFTMSVAFHVLDEGGAADFTPSWKDQLDTEEREYRRLIVLLKAAKDALEQGGRNGDDINNLMWIDDDYDTALGRDDTGMWARTRWEIDQQIDVLVQNTAT